MAGAPRILESDDGDRSIHSPIVSGWIDAPAPGPQNRPQKGSSSQRCRRHYEPCLSGAPVQRQPARPVASETFAAQAKVRHPESTISVSQGLSPTGCPGRFHFSGFLCKPLAMSGYGVASRSW
ncbi:transporter [Xanthomonas campestris pv. campestris]|nr:transporter [Xanthomonas campestris pv. campestris]RJU09777.1 transporter [Xanthomonas campestris]QCX73693.1 transporter [Xanthomonas campestris pv. campestris]RFF42531.1 transporter [Xanthomonas campestris pv. campestris]RFF69693.1 transporter [Xanthomonas campestris pv. campestris]